MSWLSFFLCSMYGWRRFHASGTEQNSRRSQKTAPQAEQFRKGAILIFRSLTAGIGTLPQRQVAGLHRAVPSTTLDKAVWLCSHYNSARPYVKLHFPPIVRKAPHRPPPLPRRRGRAQSSRRRLREGNFRHPIVTKARKSLLFCSEFLTSMLDKYSDVSYDYF